MISLFHSKAVAPTNAGTCGHKHGQDLLLYAIRNHRRGELREGRSKRCLRASAPPLLALAVVAFAFGSIEAQDGKTVYNKWCSGCHGETGAGDGVGAKTMLPHPRDFTKAVYKIRTTA